MLLYLQLLAQRQHSRRWLGFLLHFMLLYLQLLAQMQHSMRRSAFYEATLAACTATRPDVALCAAARLDNRIHTAVSVVSHAVAASLAVALISLSGLALLFLQLLAQMQLSMLRLCISSGFPGCCTFCLLPRCISLRCALVVLSGLVLRCLHSYSPKCSIVCCGSA